MSIGIEAPAERRDRFVAVCRQPLPVGFHPFTRIDRRHWRGNPSRFECVGRVRPSANLPEPELFAGLNDRCFHGIAIVPRAKQFQPRLSGHAVPQGADVVAR